MRLVINDASCHVCGVVTAVQSDFNCHVPWQVIAELLRFLKRSYWPFAWDSSAAGGSSSGVAGCLSSLCPPRTPVVTI